MSDTKKILQNTPPKGTADWFPEEFATRKLIFDNWREVCTKFGYKEYLTPIVESAEIYRAKSGEDVGGKELMTMTDRAGRELAIRPEMTPSVTRMVSRIYGKEAKPIRYFSIANFMRNEKPQRGRNREFWQLNFDIFGSNALNADIEVLQMALEIMLSFAPPKGSFTLIVNNRKLIDAILQNVISGDTEQKTQIVRILDKSEKLTDGELRDRFIALGLKEEQIINLLKFIRSTDAKLLIENLPELEANQGYIETIKIIKKLEDLGYGEWIKFQPNIIRGFDYYDGMVFELFDNNPENTRAMFGGGRYNGLAGLFGGESFPAVGCAPGDETIKLFLESWDLVEKLKIKSEKLKIYMPILDETLELQTSKIAQNLRSKGLIVELSVEIQGFGKSMQYADKQGFDYILLFGTNEAEKGEITVKNLKSGEQESLKIEEVQDKFKL
jgi:histidyl-tRNA synthetase